LERKDFEVLSWKFVRGKAWPEIVEGVAVRAQKIGAVAVFVDTLTQFAGIRGDAENSSGEAQAAMEPLQLLTAASLGVLSLRHERKAGGEVGDSGRGSSAFAGAADIVLSMRRLEGNGRPNARIIQALSRFDETPDSLVIELREGGYRVIGSRNVLAADTARD